MSKKLVIETAEVFEPLLQPARYKGAYGGRGSGKSHFFAELLIDDAMRFPGEAGEGLRGLCVREIQKSLKQSAKRLIEQKLNDFGLGEKDGFKVYDSVIKTPGDGILEFQGMQDHTAESVKSFEGFQRGWIEEGQTLSSTSLRLLRPTIRWEDVQRGLSSEIWASWNPRRRTDPVDELLRGDELPTGAIIVRANWSDNPFFPKILEQERQDCLRLTPDEYGHTWEGEYATVLKGAYYAEALALAKKQGRIGKLTADPLVKVRSYHDIGGAGKKADAYATWVVQFVGKQIYALDYYEAQGQTLAVHVNWMRDNGYDGIEVVLPHDGVNTNNVTGKRYQDHWEEAGFDVRTVPNQGPGAAMQRVQAARRLFPRIWFDAERCEPGLDALGWYHEKLDEARSIGLGPEHDWSSHGADSFGLMAVDYEEPKTNEERRRNMPRGQNSWMAS